MNTKSQIVTKEDTITAIELVVREFVNPDVIGKWFTAKERSLGNIMSNIGLNHCYSSFIYEQLKQIGLIEKVGINAQLRYRILTDVIPDVHAVAEKIYQARIDAGKDYKSKRKSVTDTQPGDLTPPKPKYYPDQGDDYKKECRKTKRVIHREQRIPHLGDVVYALVNGMITQVKITCVRMTDDNKIFVNFTSAILEKDEATQISNPIKKEDWCLRNISFTVDELLSKLQKNVVKFEKK